MQQILRLMNVDDVPQFKRNRISNQKEQVEMLMLVADYLDEETILSKLPFVTIDEVKQILKNKDAEDQKRIVKTEEQTEANEEEESEEENEQSVFEAR